MSLTRREHFNLIIYDPRGVHQKSEGRALLAKDECYMLCDFFALQHGVNLNRGIIPNIRRGKTRLIHLFKATDWELDQMEPTLPQGAVVVDFDGDVIIRGPSLTQPISAHKPVSIHE